MIGVRPAPAAVIADQPAIEPSNDFSLERVWNAVVVFFTTIIRYITDALNATWSCLKNAVLGPQTPETPTPTAAPPVAAPAQVPAVLAEKLALYANMPRDNVGLVDRSITIFQNHLQRKEEANIAALPPGAAVPDEQRPLKTFNDELDMMMNIVDLAKATVRGYVFSDCNATAQNIPFFRQVVRREVVRNDPAVHDPVTNALLVGPVQVMRDVFEDRTVRLRELRATFRGLSPQEKELILDKTDFANFDQMQLSANGRAVLDGIAEISNLLHQHNDPFLQAVQAAIARRPANPAADGA
jgi:hypothetical protein